MEMPGVGGGVRVLVDHHVDAGGARGVDHRERAHAGAPHRLPHHLVVGEHHRDPGAPADLDRLGYALDQAQPLLAQVRGVDPAGVGRRPRERDDLVDLREGAGEVAQTGREPPGPLGHRLRDHRLHPRELLGGRRPVVQRHDPLADGVVAGEEGHVHPHPQRLRAVEVGGERPGRAAVRPAERRGHALADVALGSGQLQQRVEVGVQVDEAGCDHLPVGLDHARGAGRVDRLAGDAHDAVAPDRDVRAEAGRSGAVHHGAAADQQVERPRVDRSEAFAAGGGEQDGQRNEEDSHRREEE
jgi:hypothetical protein